MRDNFACLNPDPSRIRLKEFKYFNPKKWFLRTQKYDPGLSSRIQIPDPDFDFLPILYPGVKKQPDPVSRIRIRNTVFPFCRIILACLDPYPDLLRHRIWIYSESGSETLIQFMLIC